MDLDEILAMEFLGNTVQDYFWALVVFIVSYAILYLFRVVILARLKVIAKRTKTNVDDFIIDFITGIKQPFYIYVSIFLSLNVLEVHPMVSTISRYVLLVFVIFYAVKGIGKVVNHAADIVAQKRVKEDNDHDRSMIDLLARIFKGLIWVIALLFLLSNFGIEITPLIAGLGIGGLAIAIALQGILTDIFASFSIYFDKPFKIGDFVIIGNDMGVVQHVGIKSTRIQALQGQEIVISNQELTSTRVHNFKKMRKRRIVFPFGVTYETPKKKLEKIPRIVWNIIDKIDHAEPDRVHFFKFGDSSLDYEVVYFVDIGDYNKYMDIQQAINLGIVGAFEKEGISMAYPTRTLYTPDLKGKPAAKKKRKKS